MKPSRSPLTRARVAAALAGVLFIGVSVAGVAAPASAAPISQPVFTNPAPGPDPDGQPQVEGDLQVEVANVDVVVTVTNSLGTYTYCTHPNIDTTVQPWFSCVGGVLPFGDNTFTATAFFTGGVPDADPGPTSAPLVYTRYGIGPVDATPPVSPTTEARLNWSGTGPALGTVNVVLEDSSHLCDAVPISVEGDWSCEGFPLPPGIYAIEIEAFDYEGNNAVGDINDPYDITIQPPTAYITQTFPAPWVTADAWQVQGGMTEDVDLIEVFSSTNPDGPFVTPYCSVENAVPELTLYWCNPVDSSGLTLGTNYLATRVTNAAGAVSAFSSPIVMTLVERPVILTPPNDTYTNNPILSFSGTADDTYFNNVRVADGEEGEFLFCNAAVQPDDTWSCETPPMADGVYTPFGEVTPHFIYADEVTITVDTVAPPLPEVLPTSTSDPTPTVSGTGEPFATVFVVVDGSPLDCDNPAVVAGDGTWSCTLSSALTVGVHDISARQVDRAGNTGALSPPEQAIEITAPVAPTVDQVYTPWITSAATRNIQGNKDADVTYVQVYVSPDGGLWTPYCQTSGDIVGSTLWSCDEPFGSLTMGTNLVAAIGFYGQTYSNFGPAATIMRVPPVTIDAPVDGLVTNNPTPTISGTSPTGTGVTIWGSGETTFCSAPVIAGAYACESAPLADGQYTYFAEASPGDGVTSNGSHTITIDTVAPGTPGITAPGVINGEILAAATSDPTPTISGIGEPGATITVLVDEVPISCDVPAVADGEGFWSCTPGSPIAVGNHAVAARQTDEAGNEGPTSLTQLSLTITPPLIPNLPPTGNPPPVPTPTPSPAPTPAPIALLKLVWTFGGTSGEYSPGDSVVLTGSGLPMGATVNAEIHSTPRHLGSAVADAAGNFEIAAVIPEDIEPGAHTFVITVTAPGAEPSTVQQPVTVVAPEEQKAVADKEPIGEKNAAAGGGGEDGGGGQVDRNSPNAPSALTTALDTLLDIIGNPVVIVSAAAIGLGLLLFVAIPAELLNATLSEQYGRFAKRLPRLKRAPGWWAALKSLLSSTPVVGAVLITALVSVIFGFADPAFGFDLTSLRVVLACGIGLLFVGFIANALAGIAVAKRWGLSTRMELKPLGVILAVIGVVISRLLEFTPGLMIGLLLGIALVGTVSARDEVRTTLTKGGIVFGLSFAAWVVYSLTSGALAGQSFGANLFLETLVAITTEGLTALAIGLLPFKFLEGESLWSYSRPLWVGVWLFVAAVFALVVLPNNLAEVNGSVWVWGLVVAGFAVVAVGLYVYFRFFAPPIEEDESVPEEERVGSRR